LKTIRSLRQAHGWTQFELAIKLGVQPQAVYLWESGRRTPHVLQMRKLGMLFGMCSDDIDLEPVDRKEDKPLRPHADRQPGEAVPGRDEDGRVVARGEGRPTANSD
jgi:transcriptional regulator with XRE-family HTH domain